MGRGKGVMGACLLVAAVAMTAFAGKGGMRFPEEKIPRLNVPRMSTPPQIDGAIDPGEWRESVKVMGMVNTGSLGYRDRPVSFRVAWDAEHLYIAAVSDILPGHRLWRQRRDRFTTGVVYDDAYEFGIFLHDRNKLEGEASSFQKIVINSMGAGEYMKIYPSIGQNMYNWQPDPQLTNRIYEADGRTWWALEMAMDLKDLQLPGPQKVGDRVDLLLAADLKNPGWQWLDYPSASGHLVHYGFPRMVLTETQPFIQIDEFSGLHDEELVLKGTVTNPGPKPASVAVVVKAHYGPPPKDESEGRQLIDYSTVLTVKPGKTVPLKVAESFPGLAYEKTKWGKAINTSRLSISVVDAKSEEATPIYTYHCEFAGTDKSYLQATPRTTDFDASVRFNPARNVLEVIGDTLDAAIPKGTQPAALGYTVSKDGTVVSEGRIDLLVNLKYEGFVELADVTPGTYAVKLALVDERGKELIAKSDLSFAKKDETKAFAEWWGNDIGNPEKVLKPFTAIEVDGDTAAVTRRVYTLDALGMPRKIEANGGDVLTAPARIVLTVAGEEHVVPADGTVTYTDKQEWRTEFTGGPVEVAGVAFSVQGWMEQDGLVNLDLTYWPSEALAKEDALATPSSLGGEGRGEGVNIDALRVEWPVDGSEGSWMQCIGGVGGNYAPRTIGKVPDGEGQVWDCLTDIGKAGSKMIVGNWQNNLWVGNDRRGLCWFGDHDMGWVPTETTPAHSLYRDGKAVVIRNHIIARPEGEEPFALTAARTVNLQYNATPFRHLAKGFRLTQVSACNGFSLDGKSDEDIGYKYDVDEKKAFFTVLSMPSKDKTKWPWYLEKYKVKADATLEKSLPFAIRDRLRPWHCNQIALRGYANKTREPGLYDYFGADWATRYDGESLNATYRDYMMYLMDMHVRDGGLTHYYFDISFTRSTPALSCGIGYRLPNGKVQPGSMDYNLREWYKRTWALMQEHDLYPGAVSGHATHSMPLRAMPWCDAMLDAEYPIRDACTVYTIDSMIAMSVPHNFGVNVSHHGHMDARWCTLFDAGMGGSGAYFSFPEFRHFGITADDVAYLGFWRNGKMIKPDDTGMLVSAWKRPGKVVLQVFNYGLDPEGEEKTRSATMKLDLQALGAPADLQPGQVRIRELAFNGNRVSTRSAIFEWYKHLLEKPRWPNDKEPRIRPPASPTISAAGLIDGVQVNYHDTRFLEVTWEDVLQPPQAAIDAVGYRNAERARHWGISRAESVDGLVSCSTEQVSVRAWKLPGTAMLLVDNGGDNPVTAQVQADLDALGVKVKRVFAVYTQCLGGKLDPHTGSIAVAKLNPGEQRLVFIDTF